MTKTFCPFYFLGVRKRKEFQEHIIIGVRGDKIEWFFWPILTRIQTTLAKKVPKQYNSTTTILLKVILKVILKVNCCSSIWPNSKEKKNIYKNIYHDQKYEDMFWGLFFKSSFINFITTYTTTFSIILHLFILQLLSFSACFGTPGSCTCA